MPAVSNLMLVFVAIALVPFALAVHRRRQHVRRSAQQARERLHALFTRFVAAVRDGSASECDVERFLIETVEVNALFYGGTLPRLRLALHDEALRLIRLEAAVDDLRGRPELRAAIVGDCKEKRAWFATIADAIDTLFDEPRIAPLDRFNRAIGA